MEHLYFIAGLILAFVGSTLTLKLECHPDKISIEIGDKFLMEHDMEVRYPGQLYFHGNPDCSGVRISDGYQLTIPAPFDTCGTKLDHDTGNYVYNNEIVLGPAEGPGPDDVIDSLDLKKIPIQCSYDDRYVVSSDFGLKPYVKTIYFETGQGNISVEMNLYQREDYNPKSKLGARPMVLVGFPLYVSVKTDDIFGDPAITTVLEQCYASDQPSFKKMDSLLHYLVQGRCVSPDDSTVEIIKNGRSNEARFKFDMFRWRMRQTEFIYLHCEVRICNSSAEICTGQGDLCNSVDDFGSLESLRKKRETLIFDSRESGITSVGPIAIGRISEGADGEPSVDTDLVVRKDKKYLNMYIYIAMGSMLLCCVLMLLGYIVVRRRRQVRGKQEIRSVTSSTDSFNQNQLPICL